MRPVVLRLRPAAAGRADVAGAPTLRAAVGQAAATLDEVVVQARRRPAAAGRPTSATARRAASARPPPAPPPTRSALPALQVVATTPVTGIGFDRNKVPAMVQTLTAEDFYAHAIRPACSRR